MNKITKQLTQAATHVGKHILSYNSIKPYTLSARGIIVLNSWSVLLKRTRATACTSSAALPLSRAWRLYVGPENNEHGSPIIASVRHEGLVLSISSEYRTRWTLSIYCLRSGAYATYTFSVHAVTQVHNTCWFQGQTIYCVEKPTPPSFPIHPYPL